ncbi:MAG: preprotein translocase subunit SecY [Firmicutes bacterium ADurb.Bin506]|nr:MAG: preprotein translocase subunit SecY [Firmicutes bacterium ADurb.Bin506]
MLAALVNAWKVPELRKKILFTAGLLVIYRIGSFIPVPGVDTAKVVEEFQRVAGQSGAGLLSLLDMFSGGALSRFTLFGLNVGPYITASIVIELLTVVIPALGELKKEGPEGRKKMSQYTRYAAVALAVLQGWSYTALLTGAIRPGFIWKLAIVITLTAGASAAIWLGDKITDKGIGNGISLLIFTGIVSGFPTSLRHGITMLGQGWVNWLYILFWIVGGGGLIMAMVATSEAQRKLPVQYPKRVVGRRVYGGQSTHMPMKLNQAGVIPVIFASSILAFPATIAQFVPAISNAVNKYMYNVWIYNFLYVALIIVFSYFYTGITFNPIEVADNMKKYGGFIPGFRPGRPTAEYLDRVLTRLTFSGAIFLAIVALLPNITSAITAQGISFGGTGLIIVVGVALDTLKQIEAQLIMRQYEGFLK